MIHPVNYNVLMEELCLSGHERQLQRRKDKYPDHFGLKNKEWYISIELALFIQHCTENVKVCNKLKGGLL